MSKEKKEGENFGVAIEAHVTGFVLIKYLPKLPADSNHSRQRFVTSR